MQSASTSARAPCRCRSRKGGCPARRWGRLPPPPLTAGMTGLACHAEGNAARNGRVASAPEKSAFAAIR